MRRREFMTLVVGAAWPVAFSSALRAQQQVGGVRRIGWLVGLTEDDPEFARRKAALLEGLHQLGWADGGNLQFDYRYKNAGDETFKSQAAELVGLKPDLLIANSTPATRALEQTTATIPIVFALLIDPVASGVVSDLARPNGNVTGFMNFESGMGGKWLELLKQVSPNMNKIALIYNPRTTPYQGTLQAIKAAAPAFGIEITASGVDDRDHLRDTVLAAGRIPGTAVVVFPDIFTTAHRDQIVALVAQARLPAIYPYRYFTAAGGLMSYGVDTADIFRRLAAYVDRVLKGAKPADLPVQQPTKFQFVINLKTAKAFDITVPANLLALADEVIG